MDESSARTGLVLRAAPPDDHRPELLLFLDPRPLSAGDAASPTEPGEAKWKAIWPTAADRQARSGILYRPRCRRLSSHRLLGV